MRQPTTDVRERRKTAIVFLTHFFDSEVEARLDKLLADTRRLAWIDVHLLVEPETSVPARFSPIARRFDFDGYRQGFGRLASETKIPGNMHLAALWFEETHGAWEHYWFIEYDVVYTGHWARFFGELEADTSDLLATNLREIGPDNRWHWAGSLVIGTDHGGPVRRIAGFFPIYRIGKRGLDAVRKACAGGWSGHFEILVPTAIHAAGLLIADIGGAGEWTPRRRRHRHYLAPGDEALHKRSGTFRYVPNIRSKALRGMLYHPCKTSTQRKREPGSPPYRGFSFTDWARLCVLFLRVRLFGRRI